VKTLRNTAPPLGAVHVSTTLSFDLRPYKNFREVLEHAIALSGKSRKQIAGALGPNGISENRLSMMLNVYEGKRHFPLLWLPDLLRVLGDPGKIVVQWLVNEFLLTPAERLSQAEDVLERYADVLPAIQGAMSIVLEARRKK
jgi:hypothetical protein